MGHVLAEKSWEGACGVSFEDGEQGLGEEL